MGILTPDEMAGNIKPDRDWVEIKSQRHDSPEQQIYACCNTLAVRRVTPSLGEDLVIELDPQDETWKALMIMALEEVRRELYE